MFIPVWVLRCFLRVDESQNALSHMLHLYVFSCVWALRCTKVFAWFPNFLSKIKHNKLAFDFIKLSLNFNDTYNRQGIELSFHFYDTCVDASIVLQRLWIAHCINHI